MRIARTWLMTLGFVLTTLLAAGQAPHRADASDAIAWTACDAFECATLKVPLNYDSPAGRQIEIALIRQAAASAEIRIGVILVNPGGPGGSGLTMVRDFGPGLDPQIKARFDVIGFDPRGVGKSTPIDCHDNLQEIASTIGAYETDAEWAKAKEANRKFAEACGRKYGDILPFLGTPNVARDMDRIREALGEEKINYYGASYGTTLGATYADLFPHRFRAMVLDGQVDFTAPHDIGDLNQGMGMEGALRHFADDCDKRRCKLTTHATTSMEAVDQLLALAGATPIASSKADRPAGKGETLMGIISTLYSQELWPYLEAAVDTGLKGDGSILVILADAYLGRDSKTGEYSNEQAVNNAVNCLDYAGSRDPEYYRELSKRFQSVLPHFAGAVGMGNLTCAYWPVTPAPLPRPSALDTNRIVVIGTTGDPATPHASAVTFTKLLSNAVLLTFNGEGHTAYLRGDVCIRDKVNAYLIDLRPPEDGTSCGPIALAVPLPVESKLPAAPVTGSSEAALRLPGARVNVPRLTNVTVQLSDGRALYVDGDTRAGIDLVPGAYAQRTTPDGIDLFAVATVSYGGSGRFTYLLVFRYFADAVQHIDSIQIGDSVRVTRVSTSDPSAASAGDYGVLVDYLERRPGQVQAEEPGVPTYKLFAVKAHKFIR